MNSISLRLSSSIKSEKRKVKNYGSDLILVEQLQIDQENQEFKKYLDSLKSASTIETQLEVIKKISRDENREPALNFLVHVYFVSKLKSPIKKGISCALINLKSDEGLIVECLRKKISSEISQIDQNSLEKCNTIVSILNECFQNFKLAVVAIGKTIEELLPFLKQFLAFLNNELSSRKLSPAQRNETAIYAHHTLQLIIACIKNFLLGSPIKFGIQDCLGEIIEECETTLNIEDIPMDSKINCGIVIVLKSKLKHETDYVDFILDEESSVARKLALIIGGISTMDSTDFPFLAMVSEILKDIFDMNSIDPSITLVVCRSYVQITKKISLTTVESEVLEEQDGNIEDICKASMSFAFLNFEHFMDSVRHLSKDIIKQILDFAVRNNQQKIIDDVFSLLDVVDSISLRSNLITTICGAISFEKIIEKIPNVRDMLISSLDHENTVQNQNIVNCYESLMTKNRSEKNVEEWFDFWINPLVQSLVGSPTDEVKFSLENLVKKSIKKNPKIVSRILQVPIIHQNYSFILLCVGEAKKQGCYDGVQSTTEMWRNIIEFEMIRKSMISANDDLRISALSLIIDSRKTTELFSKEEFKCIQYFFQYNINVQSPSVRQKILGLMKNLFLRVQAGIPILKRTKSELLGTYQEFLENLQNFTLQNLFPGANFTRRTLSLQILLYVMEIYAEYFQETSSNIWNVRKIKVLVCCLSDSYESNKEMTMEIMKFIPREILEKEESIGLKIIKELIVSVKPTDCLIAAYYLEFLARFKYSSSADAAIPYREFLDLICWTEEILVKGLKTAQLSLLKAARTNPLYGSLYCIKHLLEKVETNQISQNSQWQQLYERLIILCKELTDVVGPIVNDDSPEGILPKEEIVEFDESEFQEDEEQETTPQMVLLLAWRTVKEVSLILGDICLRAPLDTPESPGLVKSQQILYVCDHFIELLSRTKHRGAFEQAFVGFSKLCVRLWSENGSELHTIPNEMMKQLMISIAGEENPNIELIQLKNLCATRRSAGLPFMILGLITSELKISPTSKGLQYCMQNLLKFCQSDNLESKTHSLNILRALFRSTDLGEAIGEYVADGFKVAIRGYSSESWVVRNSSTLLFSALMVRVFGVQRTKDSDKLNIRNKMTARIFFLRYPNLYDFIHEQLEEAADFLLEGLRNPKLHPLLLLLNRLYSSALDGTENSLKLTKFIPLVSICSACPELQTRYLAARFIATVVPPDMILNRILTIYKKLDFNVKSNAVHGGLLQVCFMVRSINQEQYSCHLSKEDWNKLLQLSCKLAVQFKGNLILHSAVLDIIVEILSKFSIQEFTGSLDSLFQVDLSSHWNLGRPMEEKNFVLMKLAQMKMKNSVEDFLTKFDVTSCSYDYLRGILNTILVILDPEYIAYMSEEFAVKERHVVFIKNLFSDSEMEILRNQMKSNLELRENLLEIVKARDHYHLTIKAYQILGNLDVKKDMIGNLDEQIQKLLAIVNEEPDNMQSSIYKFLNANLKHCENFDELKMDFLYDAALMGSFLVKSSVTDILSTIFTKFPSIKSLDVILNISRCILLLLMDDEYEIREKNSKIVTAMIFEKRQENVIPIYAQELYLKLLIERLLVNFNDADIATVILSLFVDDENDEENLDSSIAEFRVFDKNEANIFCEYYVLKRQCLAIFKEFCDNRHFNVSHSFDDILNVAQCKFRNKKFYKLLTIIPSTSVLGTFKLEF